MPRASLGAMGSPRGTTHDARNAPLLDHLRHGGTVLTATRRQARHLRRLYDAAQLDAGRAVWRSADILPLGAWMAERWGELADDDPTLPVLLGEREAVWPWRARVAEATAPGSLLTTRDLASAARAAWVALRRHGGRPEMLAGHSGTSDQKRFVSWSTQTQSDLAAAGWLDPGLLEEALAEQLPRLRTGPPLLLAGFHRQSPALLGLVESLARLGWSVRVAAAPRGNGRAQSCAAADPDDETRVLVDWLRERLESDPTSSLAVIVPDHAAHRHALERAFAAGVQPGLELPGAADHDRLFDMPGGPPLVQHGIAEAALGCLDTGRTQFATGTVGRLLLSRYVASADGDAERVRLELRLRRLGPERWRAAPLARVAREVSCGATAAALEATAALSAAAIWRSAAEWAACFGAILAAWGWPGSTALASDEHQAAEALRGRLSEFAALARTAPALRFEEALAEFADLVHEPFQPERGDPAVLVFDHLEPLGLDFDGLWVAGLDAAAWPRAATPDPFIPIGIQQQLGMPGATAAACLAEAVATTRVWQAQATQVVFSWALRQDDAIVDRSGVLPEGLDPYDRGRGRPGLDRTIYALRRVESLAEDPAPQLDPGAARGGSRILELQAACPFRAFAELRLGARPLDREHPGIDSKARGSILHRALDLLWQELRDRAGLDGAAPELAERIRRCVDRALTERLPAATGARVRALEREWQCAAIAAAIRLDLGRPEFTVVRRERPVQAELAGLPLRIVPDRADRLADGSVVLIDYKTGGGHSTGSWQGQRPDQPQLPLYAVVSDVPVAAIAFANVAASGAAYAGVGRAADLVPGVAAAEAFAFPGDGPPARPWQALLAGWQATLEALARAHLAGAAEVSPKAPQTCRRCHLATLCRVTDVGPDAEDTGDD